ncbi:MAG: HAD-IC family P-type ATPase, partial [Candidatus Bipolaricaulota bacterium]|nr:HAD-IC family P-type ATPase [Candidatus Bipolaricaulota bacterium]
MTAVVPADGVEKREVLRLAASAEQGSEHPLGRAIVARAQAEGLALSDPVGFQARRGLGVVATVDGKRVLVGSPRLMEEAGIDLEPLADTLVRLEEEAQTVVVVAADGRALGVLGVADTLKDDAVAAVEELGRMGIRTAMITGDNWRTARAMARRAGIDHVLAEVLPDGKVAEVRRLQEEFGTVAFVGDGINDA